jgi:hypothetical protein
MKAVILLMVFAMPPHKDPVRPHEVLRFWHIEDCWMARNTYTAFSDGEHAYECITGVVIN